jgi:type IV pilus assembly protein PilF
LTRAAAVRCAAMLAGCALAAALLAACAGSTGNGGGGGEQHTRELRTLSDQTSAEKRAQIRLQLAVGYYQDRKYDFALDEVKQAIDADPSYADAYGLRALIYTGMGENTLADENYRHALRLAPRNPDLANNYGLFLCGAGGKPAEAMTWFDGALKNPMYASPVVAMINAGNCSLKMKNTDAAERYMLDALRYDPQLPTVNVGLARIYFDRRDQKRAGFFINRLMETAKPETLPADALWLAIRIERQLGDRSREAMLASQLRKRFPGSPEYAAFERGAFNE